MFRRKKKNTANIAETNNTKHETDLLKPLDPLYKTIFESMLDGVVVQDKDGKIVLAQFPNPFLIFLVHL